MKINAKENVRINQHFRMTVQTYFKFSDSISDELIVGFRFNVKLL